MLNTEHYVGTRRSSRSSNLSTDDVENLQEMFEDYDINADGELDRTEIGLMCLELCGYYANEAALQEMIQCLRPIEASAANGVNFEEFKESKQPLPIIRKIASSKILHEIAEWQAFRCGLPTNLLHLILRFLGEIQVLQRMAWVCKAWAAVSNSDYLWKPLLLGRRRSEQIKPQTYGMLPAINVKSNYRSWYLDWLEARAAENDLRKQEETYKREVQRTGSFLYQPQMTAITAYRWNDRQIVLTGDEKGNVYVWDPYAPEKQAVLDTLRQHDGPICDIVVSPSHFVTCSGDGTSHVWEHGDMTFPKYTMAVHNEAVETAAVLASDEMMIVTGSMDRSVLAWNLRKTAPQPREKVRESYTHVQVLAKCVGHTMKITVLRVTQQRIYSASTDATVRIWDWAGTCIATLEGHNGPVHCMELRTMQDRQGSDRLWLISACGGGALRAWHPETGKAAWARTIHKAPIHCMVCDDDLIFTGSSDAAIHIFSTSTEMLVAVLKGHESIVRRLHFDVERRRLISSSDDKVCGVYDLRSTLQTQQRSSTPTSQPHLRPRIARGLVHVTPTYQLRGPKSAIIDCVMLSSNMQNWDCCMGVTNDKAIHLWYFK
jgi:WD40 repeat protein|mmetsp:Transcript_2082/g.3839  ORF Transcript_2082/g.3839 Transcript_2082/m.3839 type:complete len:602 (+) Transcript_2082:57-1862(+)|eukprot:CAMPEP_0174311596 /NCGR_PEP_ID=MMETSP0810-20121108/3795_1 /TAXON_ID=73025 ORGANISM="Eutreptiella gymnastica-like, Strain CCMP1594" /NCGR_SAMPLE_ID=MMETSP0810 /ASSEMBLY_ACC=CAM_ASM_000659 /LENGTH=601 /DNA_ID=CAMNT_0015419841 /DNA_START=57 /DNA_END=1862 /DNA_ORIENTATION=+